MNYSETIEAKSLHDEINRLYNDKRFKNNPDVIEALEAVKSWSLGEPIEVAEPVKDERFVLNVSDTSDIILGSPAKHCEDVFVVPEYCYDHVCVIGPSGSGKTWNYILTNIMQVAKKQQSFFVVDCGGHLHNETADMLKEQGYNVVVLNDKRHPSPEDFDFAVMQEAPYACFCTISEIDPASAVSAKEILSACLGNLWKYAGRAPDMKLKTPVHFFLDEFTNLGNIEAFRMECAAALRRGIHFSIFLQSIAQLQAVYPEDWHLIASKCDATVCLGIVDCDTLEFIDRRLKDVGVLQKAEREAAPHHFARRQPFALSYDSKYPELTTLRADECLIISRGTAPCKLFKFNPEKHPFYSKLSPELSSAQSIRFDNYSVDELTVFINDFIQRTDPVNPGKDDPLRSKAETALLKACFFFLHSVCVPEDQSLAGVMKLLSCANVPEGQENADSTLDILFQDLEEEGPEHIAVQSYKVFKSAGGGKAAQFILANCLARLQRFDLTAVI